MKKRVVFRVQLKADSKKKLIERSDELGITQIALMSKLLEWFADQPPTLQVAVLGLYPDSIKQDVARLILEQMATRPAPRK